MKHRKQQNRKKVGNNEDGELLESPTQKRMDPQIHGLIVIIGVAFVAMALRTWHVIATVNVPTSQFLLGDAAGYFQWAQRIAAGNWYGDDTFYQAPCYPYFLAVLMRVFDVGVTGARMTQALLGSVSVIAMGLATWHWFGKKAGIGASIMLALYSPSIYYDGIIQKTSLAAFLTCCLLLGSAWFAKQRTHLAAVVCGACLGLLVLTRENALLWLPVFPVWIYLTGSESRRLSGTQVFAFVAGLSLFLLPVAARNASLGGEWSPTTFQAGPNFYIGNNLSADGIYRPLVPGHETPLYERADAVRIAEETSGRSMSSREVSKFWMAKSFDEINQSRMRWLQLMAQKSFMLVNHFEVPDVESINVYREQSAVLMMTKLLNFGILFPLACCGLFLHVRNSRQHLILIVLAGVMAIAVVAFFILGRYRLPLAILLVPFAASGLIGTVDLLRERRFRPLVGIGAIFVCIFGISHLPVHDQTGLNASSLMNAGIACAQRDNMELSLQLLQRARTIAPELGEVHFNLGMAWSKLGDPFRALACFRQALRVDPTLIQAKVQIDRLSRMTQTQPE